MWPCEQNGRMGAPTDCTLVVDANVTLQLYADHIKSLHGTSRSVEFCTTCMTESTARNVNQTPTRSWETMWPTSSAYRTPSRKRNMHTAHWVEQIYSADSNACHLPPHAGGYRHACTTTFLHTYCSMHHFHGLCTACDHAQLKNTCSGSCRSHPPANRENDERCTHDCCAGQTAGPTQRHSRLRHVGHGCAAVHRAKFQICAGIMPISGDLGHAPQC
jgi:hypothetical protein